MVTGRQPELVLAETTERATQFAKDALVDTAEQVRLDSEVRCLKLNQRRTLLSLRHSIVSITLIPKAGASSTTSLRPDALMMERWRFSAKMASRDDQRPTGRPASPVNFHKRDVSRRIVRELLFRRPLGADADHVKRCSLRTDLLASCFFGITVQFSYQGETRCPPQHRFDRWTR